MRLELVEYHGLGVEAAKARLKGFTSGTLPSGVKLLKALWEETQNRLTLDLQVKGVPQVVQAVVEINPSDLHITTNDLPWYTTPFLPFIKAELHNSLQKVLV